MPLLLPPWKRENWPTCVLAREILYYIIPHVAPGRPFFWALSGHHPWGTCQEASGPSGSAPSVSQEWVGRFLSSSFVSFPSVHPSPGQSVPLSFPVHFALSPLATSLLSRLSLLSTSFLPLILLSTLLLSPPPTSSFGLPRPVLLCSPFYSCYCWSPDEHLAHCEFAVLQRHTAMMSPPSATMEALGKLFACHSLLTTTTFSQH